MSNYTNGFGASTKDSTNAIILAADIGTELDLIVTAITSKATKVASPTTDNIVTMDSGGDAKDSGKLITDKADVAGDTYTGVIDQNDATDSTTGGTGSIHTDGGIGAVKDIVTDAALIAATVKPNDRLLLQKGADVASATNVTLSSDGNYFDITGTTTIATFATIGVGAVIKLHFDGILTLTHSNDLFLPGAVDIITGAGDELEMVEYATADWRVTNFVKASGSALTAPFRMYQLDPNLTTYVVASDVADLYVFVSGASGGTNDNDPSGGGGGCGYSEKIYITPASSYAYAIGAGAAITDNAIGGTTTFGTADISVTGARTSNNATGGAAGVGSGGTFNATGGAGGNGSSEGGGGGGAASRCGGGFVGGAGGAGGGGGGGGSGGAGTANGGAGGVAKLTLDASAIVIDPKYFPDAIWKQGGRGQTVGFSASGGVGSYPSIFIIGSDTTFRASTTVTFNVGLPSEYIIGGNNGKAGTGTVGTAVGGAGVITVLEVLK